MHQNKDRLNISVLYVEDEIIFRETISSLLEPRIRELIMAKDGEEGFEAYKVHRPDIVISDISMPRMNGLRMLKKIKKINPQAICIITTSYSDTNYFLDAIDLGVNRFILKPFDIQELINTLKTLSNSIIYKQQLEAEEKRRLQTEEALRESEERFRLMFLEMPGAIVLAHPENGKIIEANNAALKLFGYSKEEFLTFTQKDITEDHNELIDAFNAKAKQKTDGSSIVGEFKVKLASGKSIPVEIKQRSIHYHGSEIFIGFITDISSRKQQEEMRQRYQEALEKLVQIRTEELQKSNEDLKTNIISLHKAQKQIENRSLSEHLLSEISSNLVNIPHYELDNYIRSSLQKLGEFKNARSTFVRIQNKSQTIRQIFRWHSKDCPNATLSDEELIEKQAELWKAISRSKHIIVEPENQAEAENNNAPALTQGLYYQLLYNNEFYGFIGIEHRRQQTRLSEQDTFLPGMLGEVILNAFFRKHDLLRTLEKEETAHALINANTEIMLLIDKNAKVLDLNDKAIEKLKINKGSSLYTSNTKFITVKRLRSALNVFANGKKIQFTDTFKGQYYEHTFYPVLGINSIIERIAIHSRDITQKVKGEQEIQRQNQFLNSLLESIPSPVFIKNLDGFFIGCNQELVRLTGKPKDQIISKTPYDLSPKEMADFYTLKDKELYKSKGIQNYESKFIGKNGIIRDIAFYKSLFYDGEGNPDGIIGVMIDITKVKKDEKQLRELNENLENRVKEELSKTENQRQLLIQKSKLESLGELSAGMAHEINQPLGGISMGLENILYKLNDNRLDRDYLRSKIDYLFENISRIKQIISHIRTFSRDQQHISKEKVSISEVIKNALMLIEVQFKSNQVNLIIKHPEEDCFFLGNKYRTEQVLLNLLSNARDAVNQKAVLDSCEPGYQKTIIIRYFSTSEQCIIEVSDNGTGIKPENIGRIFEPFYTTKSDGSGTGLGLSINYGIVQDMGGEIKVESKNGLSTLMRVIFPKFVE